MRLAVIPARGGSKRIPRKNIRDFQGKPMIAWSIDVALESACFDHVIVSTDDVKIAQVAEEYGAEVPFLRPGELADDYTPTLPVVQHAIREAEKLWGKATDVCCIYATAPLLHPQDLRRGFDSLISAEDAYVLSVTSYSFPIQRALKKAEDDTLMMFQPEHAQTRSQDLPEAWHDAGQFYWARATTWKAGGAILADGAVGVPLPRVRVQDIDTSEDWAFAEMLFAHYKSKV